MEASPWFHTFVNTTILFGLVLLSRGVHRSSWPGFTLYPSTARLSSGSSHAQPKSTDCSVRNRPHRSFGWRLAPLGFTISFYLPIFLTLYSKMKRKYILKILKFIQNKNEYITRTLQINIPYKSRKLKKKKVLGHHHHPIQRNL